MKSIIHVLAVSGLLTLGLFADNTPVSPKGNVDFTGKITAIESSRNSFTISNPAGLVKMFSVTPEQKSKLAIGQEVTVTYSSQATWPLPATSITPKQASGGS